MSNTAAAVPTYTVGQKALNDERTIVAIDSYGKVCVEDLSAAGTPAARFQPSRKWYKPTSPILARVFGGQS